MGNFVWFYVIDTGEFGNFLGKDGRGLVGNLLGVFRTCIGDGDFEHLSILDIGNRDMLSKLVGFIVKVKVVNYLLKNEAAFDEFAISGSQLLVDVNVVKCGARVGFFVFLRQENLCIGAIHWCFDLCIVNVGSADGENSDNCHRDNIFLKISEEILKIDFFHNFCALLMPFVLICDHMKKVAVFTNLLLKFYHFSALLSSV